jgi:peptide subunit release factor 1 (eRF1)
MTASSTASTIRDLPDVLQAVQRNPSDRFLSVFLDTSAQRSIGQGYQIEFRDLCKTMRTQLESADGDDKSRFETAVAQAESYLSTLTTLGAAGLAIFATGLEGGPLATPLPIRPAERVVWAERPAIEPLVAALDECERIVVLLFDKEQSRLVTIFLGEIEARQLLVDDVPGKQGTGDWFALSQKRYERHHEDHVLRHAKRTIHGLSEELQTRPCDRLFIAGPEEAVSFLVHLLPRPLRSRFAGTLALPLYAGDAEVLAAAREAGEAVERREEVEAVQALIDAETSPRTVLGLESTLGALAAGRVHRLFVAADLTRDGAVCETCGRLTGDLDRCLSCAGTTRPFAGLKEQAVERALAQDARVEIVAGLASKLLMRHGGLGAIARY